MKLVLTNFGQDISLTGEESTVYLVFTDEETGKVFRLPTVQETITRLAQVMEGVYEGEPPMPGDEPQPSEEPSDEELPEFRSIADEPGPVLSEEEPQEEHEVQPPPPAAPRKRIVKLATNAAAPSPMRSAMAKVKQRLDEDPEGKVPSL